MNMLVKIYNFDRPRAEAVCKGFALDQRVRHNQLHLRYRSCTCKVAGAKMFDENHGHKKNGVPAGFTSAVEDKYHNFH